LLLFGFFLHTKVLGREWCIWISDHIWIAKLMCLWIETSCFEIGPCIWSLHRFGFFFLMMGQSNWLIAKGKDWTGYRVLGDINV
jgi:hypothetical protein